MCVCVNDHLSLFLTPLLCFTVSYTCVCVFFHGFFAAPSFDVFWVTCASDSSMHLFLALSLSVLHLLTHVLTVGG